MATLTVLLTLCMPTAGRAQQCDLIDVDGLFPTDDTYLGLVDNSSGEEVMELGNGGYDPYVPYEAAQVAQWSNDVLRLSLAQMQDALDYCKAEHRRLRDCNTAGTPVAQEDLAELNRCIAVRLMDISTLKKEINGRLSGLNNEDGGELDKAESRPELKEVQRDLLSHEGATKKERDSLKETIANTNVAEERE
ncbi:MAG: hypothetical protein AAF563_07840 [Pseudomonadota bacterium]